jgi:hypothetical protein
MGSPDSAERVGQKTLNRVKVRIGEQVSEGQMGKGGTGS